MSWNARRTYSGGGFGIGPGFLSPFIKAMLLVNTALFIATYFAPKLTFYLGLTPALFLGQFPQYLWQPFTYMFMHGGFGHIFFNMFALWMFGTEIERTWGTRTFGRFYLLAGLAGAFLTLIVKYNQMAPMVGASAAVYGVLAVYWLMFPDRQLYIYFLFPVKVKYAIPGLMIIGFFFGGGTSCPHGPPRRRPLWSRVPQAGLALVGFRTEIEKLAL
jgi:membrane associated rhomboid family serine protease